MRELEMTKRKRKVSATPDDRLIATNLREQTFWEKTGKGYVATGAVLLVIVILSIAAFVSSAKPAPLCVRVATGEMVQCYSDQKIDAALEILNRRGFAVDRSFVISIEINIGKFRDAKALADWIMYGV